MEIGKHNILTVRRIEKGGVLLGDEGGETYLPGPEVPPGLAEGQELRVFVYNSQKNEIRATLMTPKGELGDFAFMEVVDVNSVGAFLNWGIPKDLFVPRGTQKQPLRKGEKTIVYIALDSKKTGIIGFTDITPFASRDFSNLKPGQQVKLLVWRLTSLGAQVIVNNQFAGLVYRQDIDEPLEPGQRLPGWIRKLRKDGKLDVGLWQRNIEKAESLKARFLRVLADNGGILLLTDKSDPQVLRAKLNMSKRMFKMTVGMLLKEGRIERHEAGIILPGKTPPRAPKVLKVKARAEQLSRLMAPECSPKQHPRN